MYLFQLSLLFFPELCLVSDSDMPGKKNGQGVDKLEGSYFMSELL